MKYALGISLLLLGACTTTKPVQEAAPPLQKSGDTGIINCPNERVFVTLLSTRKHQLSGENPTVGVFDSMNGGQEWSHSGWKQGRHFAVYGEPRTCGFIRYVAAGNGLFRTLDNGKTWRIVTDWQQTEIMDVAVSKFQPSLVFTATPYGIFRSNDRGDSWVATNNGLRHLFANTLRVDYSNPKVVIAGTEAGIARSEDQGDSWNVTLSDKRVHSVRQHPSNSSIWVAGLKDDGVAISVDFGRTWRMTRFLKGTFYEVEFGVEPEELWAVGWNTGVWYSKDLGNSWEQRITGLSDLNLHSLAVSRQTPGKLWVGSMGGGLFLSEDKGMSWKAHHPDRFEAGQIWDIYLEGE
jgi:photosystem II stability/assembly factor-like uncharacterized protein